MNGAELISYIKKEGFKMGALAEIFEVSRKTFYNRINRNDEDFIQNVYEYCKQTKNVSLVSELTEQYKKEAEVYKEKYEYAMKMVGELQIKYNRLKDGIND